MCACMYVCMHVYVYIPIPFLHTGVLAALREDVGKERGCWEGKRMLGRGLSPPHPLLGMLALACSLLGVHAALLGDGGEGQALGVGHVAVRRKAAGLCTDYALRVRNEGTRLHVFSFLATQTASPVSG